jgi:magnesium-transporting ATPase (P-type)
MGRQGLTTAEVAERRRRGLVNQPHRRGAGYWSIVARNLFTLFNATVAPAAVALFLLGEYRGAVAASGMAVVNTLIGLVHETLAKRHLDRLALLAEGQARVIRDGWHQTVPASEVVQGDHLCLSAGAVVVADGPLLEADALEIEEALLTGESEPVGRRAGDNVLSGSFCVAGAGVYRADRVGDEAFASRTERAARRYRHIASPLTRVIHVLIQALSGAAVGLCLLYLGLYFLRGFSEVELVQMVAATITAMVPQGLVLTATLAFTLGAVKLSTRGAVVQRLSAVESMASVDVLCLDKTGTLTTNRLQLALVHRLAGELDPDAVRGRLRLFASASLDGQDRVVGALRSALGEAAAERLHHVPFKARNCYSAVEVRDGTAQRLLVLGACEVVGAHLAASAGDREAAWRKLLPTGWRILMFAEARPGTAWRETLDGMELRPLALVAFGDEMRAEASEVLGALSAQGIMVKVLSGDHPETVRAALRAGGVPLADSPVVTGQDLDAAPDPTGLIRTGQVFGRVSPGQKVQIVRGVQAEGRCVAMIGDGVNDVLAIKQADLGIAMASGCAAARAVAGLVLGDNRFTLLPEALDEGQVIVRNLRLLCKVFLVKNVYSLVLLAAGSLGLFALPFPYLPQQVTLLDGLVLGLPALTIALSRGQAGPARSGFLREVGWFAMRTGLAIALAALVMLLLSVHAWHDAPDTQRTLLLSVLVGLGVITLLRALAEDEGPTTGGWHRLHLLAAAILPLYLLAMYWPPSADFLRLVPLSLGQWGWVCLLGALGHALCLLTDPARPA